VTGEIAKLSFVGIGSWAYLVSPLENGEDVIGWEEFKNWVYRSSGKPL
jgi:hypothetical protein